MRIVKILSLMLITLTALLLVACESNNNGHEDVVTNIQLSGLSGQGTLQSPYVMNLNVGENNSANILITPSTIVDYDLEFVLGTLSEGKFTSSESVGIKLATNNSKTTLSLDAIEEGVFAVEVKLKGGDLVRYVLVTVEEEGIEPEDILVTSIMFPTIELGSGTHLEPYEVSIDYSQSENFSFAIQPNNATNKEMVWSIVKLVDDEFMELSDEDTPAIELTATSTRLTIKGLVAGKIAYVKGETLDASDIQVYIQVTVSDFIAVESITIDHLLEGDETDYYFKTAVGTTWDMSDTELARKMGLIEGTAGPGAGQAVNDITYWPNLYEILVNVAPEDASNSLFSMEYSEPGIFELNLDGSYEALASGSTVLTISSISNPEVSITIKIEVEDTIYPGILTSAFNAKETSELSEWNFDGNPDNLGSRPLLEQWENVFLQTNTRRGATGEDGNQKIFYLGTSDRVYGIALESRVNEGRGNINMPTAMIWNKVYVSEEATTIDLVIGNNDKVHNQYRVLFVDEDGVVYLVSDWTSLTTPNDSKRVNDLAVPEAVKGKAAALVIEQRLTEKENNAEVHIKGIWLNQYTPVTAISLPETSGVFGQGATFNLNATVSPGSATNKTLSYQAPVDSNITITENGQVTVGLDTPVGEYILTVISVDNPLVFEEYVLTVESYVPVTSFDILEFEDGEEYTATFDPNSGVNHTDAPIQLTFVFNEEASNTNWTKEVTGTSVEVTNEGKITFIGEGQSVLTITPEDNPSLAITFTFNVVLYTEESKIANEVQINQTEANNSPTSFDKVWNTQALVRAQWRAENINKNHGGSKVADYGDGDGRIVLEGHATSANFVEPINIIWNKVNIGENDQSFKFLVRSHDDDRTLESSNFRVKIITLGEAIEVDTLLDWTTVAGRWKQNQYWFEVILDISNYQNKEVIILIEQTGSLQNNGEWAKHSDSGAGAYLHIKGFEILETQAPDLNDVYHMYAAFNPGLQSSMENFLTIHNNPYQPGINVYEGDDVKPFSIDYIGDLGESITLPTATPFINNGSSEEPAFYLWGLFPALNNSHVNNLVSYELVSDGAMSLDGNEITFNSTGTGELIVKYLSFNSTENYINLHITITVK